MKDSNCENPESLSPPPCEEKLLLIMYRIFTTIELGKPFEIKRISVADMESKIEEAEKANDMIGTYIWTTPLRILEGDFWWDDKTAQGVDIKTVFPDEKFESLEGFLSKWW